MVVLAAALLFGGGSHAGFMGDVYVQLLAAPLLVLSCQTGWRGELVDRVRQSSGWLIMGVTAVLLLAVILQIVPLPVGVVSSQVPDAALLGERFRSSWGGISAAPAATWAAAISMLPPLAIFVAVSQLAVPARFWLIWLVTALGALSLLVGLLQIAQGAGSYLRFFEFTNTDDAVGFFANRNHFAALLYCTLVFASVWFAFTANDFIKPGALNTRAILWFAAAAALLVATIAGLAMARSRAGIFLAMAGIAGVAALFWASGRLKVDGRVGHHHGVTQRNRQISGVAIAVLGVAVVFAMQFGLHRMLTRFDSDPLEDLRMALTPITFGLALENLPFGSGLGTFVPVYAAGERAADLFTGYANRAHNDFAEFLLETGLFGLVTLGLFLTWVGMRIVSAWRREAPSDDDGHLILQRGASLVIMLLLAHSLVDYPLRTTSLAALFALACAILIQPPEYERPIVAEPSDPKPKRRRRRSPPRLLHEPVPCGSVETDWGEIWRKAGTEDTAKRDDTA